ncbi:hypothetical protein [Dyella sedimenti]|uniref:hypothetical protein n=1 Tax=Dyella sedimenti TaxID=2919947 RepID=UPI001FAADF25|nr:hypothetical protein [Dyella sedimenti]
MSWTDAIGQAALGVASPATVGIPFRTDSAVAADRLLFAMLGVSLVLVAVLVALYVAKRRGWLKGMMPAGLGRKDDPEPLVLRAAKRISASTSVYVLASGDREFLVVESARGVTSQIRLLGCHGDSRGDLP